MDEAKVSEGGVTAGEGADIHRGTRPSALALPADQASVLLESGRALHLRLCDWAQSFRVARVRLRGRAWAALEAYAGPAREGYALYGRPNGARPLAVVKGAEREPNGPAWWSCGSRRRRIRTDGAIVSKTAFCERCVFWDPTGSDGLCRVGRPDKHGMWPATAPKAWCGEFQPEMDDLTRSHGSPEWFPLRGDRPK